ncbi:hypothetical protein NSS64_15665 [Paenibacillus sp. FSL H8-0122]|uniref:hypothetical protein n=1 Tax=Paenibacillus sp. FSL H8-0122 TaxID=2954510 RepID=UPI0030FD016F
MLSSKPKISFYLTLLIISTLFISDSVAMGAGGKTYYYDTNGRLVNEALRSNEIMEYQYDLNGNVKRKFRSNNMLVNPNFELNTSRATDIANGWDKWSDTGSALFQVIPASVVSKSVAQKVSASGMRLGTAAWLFQDVAVKGNLPVLFNGDVSIESINKAKASLCIQYFDAANTLLSEKTVDYPSGALNSYMTLSLTDITPPNTVRARAHVGIRTEEGGGSGAFYVDNMAFRYDTAGNILNNPSFENNLSGQKEIAESWSRWSDSGGSLLQVVSSPVTSGVRAQKLTTPTMKSGGASWLFQDVIVQPNVPISASGNIVVDQLTSAKVCIVIQFFDEKNKFLSQQTVDYPAGILKKYMTLALNTTTPSDAVRARVHVGIQAIAEGGNGAIYVDHMALNRDPQRNMLSNPSFDANSTANVGIADSWQTWSDTGNHTFQVVGPLQTANTYGQKFTSANMKKNGAAWLLQDVVVSGNKLVEFKGNILVESVVQTKVSLCIQFFDRNDALLSEKYVDYPVGVLQKFSTLSLTEKTPSKAVSARVHVGLQATAAGGSGTFYVKQLILKYSE